MKKKFMAILIIMTMIFGAMFVPSFGATKSKSKYIKIKRSVYQKYKKENKRLVKENIKLKEELAKLKSESKSDLTNQNEYAIIMAEHEQIILNECELSCVDYMALVDCYVEGKWYCYYICADGDCYTVTIKNEHIDMFVQLN